MKLLTRNLRLLNRNWSLKSLLEKFDLSNQDVRQAADANIPQLEPLEAEAVEVEAEVEEVDFTPMVVMEEMMVATVMVEETEVTMMITVTMILKMMMNVLLIHVVTTCISLLHRPHLHPLHLPLICATSLDSFLAEPTLRSSLHEIHPKLFYQIFHRNFTEVTNLLEPLIIERNL